MFRNRYNFALALCLLGVTSCESGCALNWKSAAESSIRYTDSAVRGAESVAFPLFKLKCEAIARVCQSRGDQLCPEFHACAGQYGKLDEKLRKAYTVLARAKAALAMGQQGEYLSAINEALGILDELKRTISELEKLMAGWLADRRKSA